MAAAEIGLDHRGILHDLLRLAAGDRKSTRLNSSHMSISYAVFCLKKKIKQPQLVDSGEWPERRNLSRMSTPLVLSPGFPPTVLVVWQRLVLAGGLTVGLPASDLVV